ncbi:signal peptidase I [Enterococcus sp. MJM12]|uniref:Signal peptidase I n=1 Tax=Candidatus Enterococcus myersii TaxID=2815322 RepID=A0ABS3H970_9ENTE|nr:MULTISPECIES: signal peptidase I [Enterococcus]MBO0450007.1 signal peptidase I [Enterococcus sp. MJM12]MCD1023307.1 signal peptidase I [Enterococcus sp. SMC-9]MDT2738815.1 signal peptidase I [Enterococcus canintestini]WHA08127.1 signal peptidase I [Enterococcus montenegrensis]
MKKMKISVRDIAIFGGFIAILIIIRIFIFSPVIVDGSSMAPTLYDGDRGFALKIGKLQRFSIVVLNNPDQFSEEEKFIKRIIGLPGEKIEYKNNNLFINDKATSEGFKTGDMVWEMDNFTYRIPKGEYFVLGDNRDHSTDSRNFGSIHRDEIIGAFRLRFYPISSFRLF